MTAKRNGCPCGTYGPCCDDPFIGATPHECNEQCEDICEDAYETVCTNCDSSCWCDL